MNPRFISAAEIEKSFTFRAAVLAVEQALQNGLDPAKDLPRSILPIAKGELLMMPSSSAEGSGIKVLTIAPENHDIELHGFKVFIFSLIKITSESHPFSMALR